MTTTGGTALAWIDWFHRVTSRVSMSLLKLTTLAISLACLMIMYDSLGRLLFNSPLRGTTEIVRNLVVLIAFLQVPESIQRRELLRVSFVYVHFSDRIKRLIDCAGYLLGALIFATVAVINWPDLMKSIATNEYEGSAAFYMPMAPIRLTAMLLWIAAAVSALSTAAYAFLYPAHRPADTLEHMLH